MAEKEFEADDPYEFVAMRFQYGPGVDGDAVMVRCLVEEYALVGMPREKAMHIFRSPAFAGSHTVFRSRGPEFIQQIIDDVYGVTPQEVP